MVENLIFQVIFEFQELYIRNEYCSDLVFNSLCEVFWVIYKYTMNILTKFIVNQLFNQYQNYNIKCNLSLILLLSFELYFISIFIIGIAKIYLLQILRRRRKYK
ncbi:hypothetical protein EDEG_02253 [Edhazardia aedis USNM 41457]|uniref:Transmembrane protein n=1 Tax=Edhazardia aedis (strain USNM 41457) TaxID=1003232 RepID=J9D6G8_EDHAE|nr:hypothetical protein EDEG_02253 [Edhazardia aedis USNM 41457]|eukprot:EJW03396.1 hypothetical protein EDEG_02253 [Edhazardia aedis USNM 41457]